MTEIIQYPRAEGHPWQSPEDQLKTAWCVADALAKVLVEVGRDEAWALLGAESERMVGPTRSPSEEAQSMGLIYTLRVALGVTDEAGDPVTSP